MINNSAFLPWRGIALLALTGLVSCTAPPVKPPESTQSVHHRTTATPAPPQGTPKDILQQAAAKPSMPFEGDDWQPMFDGTTLTGWRETAFTGQGPVQCESGLIVLNMGDPFTGINWTNEFPKINFEAALD